MKATDVIARMLLPIRRKIAMLVARCLVYAVSVDAPGHQKVGVQVMSDETQDEIDRFQEYGWATAPPADGSVGVLLSRGGDRGSSFVVTVDNVRYRFKALASGEVCLFTQWDGNTAGHRIHFKSDQSIEVYGGAVSVYADEVKLGDDTAQALCNAGVVGFFNTHFHNVGSSPTTTPLTPMEGVTTTKVRGT